MVSFNYTINDPLGIHARPAGMLVRKASTYKSNIFITLDDKKADAKRIFALMQMKIKNGNNIQVVCEGEDEEEAGKSLMDFFAENL